MKDTLIGISLCFLILAGCVVVPADFDDDDYRPRERARSECAEVAHDQGYRRVDVQSVRSINRDDWEVMMQGRDKSGRDARLRCEYDSRYRRTRVTRVDR